MNRHSLLFLTLAFGFSNLATAQDPGSRSIFGPRYHSVVAPQPPANTQNPDPVHRWNEIAINATGLDHTNAVLYGQQLGPGRSSRAMAIIHIAIFNAINSLIGDHQNFAGVAPSEVPQGPVSWEAAVAQAAHDTLVAVYSAQSVSFDNWLAQDLAAITNSTQRANGVLFGHRVAAAVLASRVGDHSEVPEPHLGVDYFPSNLAGHWRQDPISLIPVAVGAHWGECTPFVTPASGHQFRTPPPPPMNNAAYTAAYNEVKRLGGDGVTTTTERTEEQTFIGTFWAYDGTPSLCAPPRLYNQITVTIADQTNLNPTHLARLLVLVNVAMADTGIAVWDSKYYWDFWRPVTGIRESDVGTGPSGAGDGNPQTVGDPAFHPLGAPASNLTGPNFTPPFPAYPSGHAGFGGALFQTLRRFYNSDRISFTFVSDEFNGTTRANDGTVRPYRPRTFSSFSQAEEENGQSRIYLGIHWSFDKTEGIAQGRRVADYVFDNAFGNPHPR